MKNIAIISLINNASKKIAQKLCVKTQKLYTNADDLLEFNLGDLKNALDVGGVAFFDKEQYHIVDNATTFENAVITLSYNTFSKKNIFEILKQRCTLIFVKFDLNQFDAYNKKLDKNEFELNRMVFYDRQSLIEQKCEYTVDGSNKKEMQIVNEIIKLCTQKSVL